MNYYIEVKARYNKMHESGAVKKTTETFMVRAITCSEAEQKVIEYLKPYVSGELIVSANKITKIAEVHNPDEDRFFLAKVAFITINEKSGEEKSTITQILVGAENFDEARSSLDTVMKGSMADWEISSLSESSVISCIK